MVAPKTYSPRTYRNAKKNRPRVHLSARAPKEHWLPVFPAHQKNIQIFTALCIGRKTWSALFLARSGRLDPANTERSQHPHPIFTIITPPTCNGLFFCCALVRQHVPPARCPPARLCWRWGFQRSRLWGSGPGGVPRDLNLSDGWQIRALSKPLSKYSVRLTLRGID